MAFTTDNGNPVAFGTGQSGGDDRALFLKQFGGEVLTAFMQNTLMVGKTTEKSIGAGKSWQFPRTGASSAEYLTRGKEMLGNDFATDEVTVTVDAPLVSSHALWDLDVLMSHFDVRGPMTQEMGAVLSRVYDQNCMRSVILAARTAAVAAIPNSGGGVFTSADVSNVSGTADGIKWMNYIRKVKVEHFQAKNIPPGAPIYMLVNPVVFDAIKYATVNGTYVNLHSLISLATAGVGSQPTEAIRFEGVTIFTSNLLPSTNETANASVYAKYRADYSKTTGFLWSPGSVASLSLLGITVETDRDVRRQEDFIVAKRVNGHGTLRSELAVELKLPA